MRELCRQGLDADTFRRQLRARLQAVIAFDAYCVNTVDPNTLAPTSSVGDGLDADAAAKLFSLEHARTDVNVLADLAQAEVNVATIGPNPERSERMRSIFLPLGLVDELRAALVERGRCWGYLHLFRSTMFTAADVRAVTSLVPDLGMALRCAAEPTPRAAPLAGPAVMTFGPDARLRATTTTTRDLLAALPTDETHPGPPHAVVSAAAAATARRAVVESTMISPRGLLRIVALPEADGSTVVVDSARPAQVVETLFARHRLTAREEEVCRCILRGLSDKEIAATLGVGTETVKAHSRAAFTKLSVSGRGGLIAKLSA